MKEIAEKYPKFWEDYDEWLHDTQNLYEWMDEDDGLPAHFGFLILEYFPKHGIEIERYIDNGQKQIIYFLVVDNVKDYDSMQFYLTPQEAISKAAEIRERQLEGK